MPRFCHNCAAALEEPDAFCSGCGAPVEVVVAAAKPVAIMTPWRAKKILANRPATALDALNRKEWWQVGILDLANFFLKCWLANLLIAVVLGILGGAIWLGC